jgi:hypothetical protein
LDATWQELEDGIDAAIDGAATAQATSKGEPDDMLVEVVETVRRIERYMDGDMKRASVASDLLVTPWSHKWPRDAVRLCYHGGGPPAGFLAYSPDRS